MRVGTEIQNFRESLSVKKCERENMNMHVPKNTSLPILSKLLQIY